MTVQQVKFLAPANYSKDPLPTMYYEPMTYRVSENNKMKEVTEMKLSKQMDQEGDPVTSIVAHPNFRFPSQFSF